LKRKKPQLYLSRDRDEKKAAIKVMTLFTKHPIHILNIAGPRQSEESEVGSFVRQTLEEVDAIQKRSTLAFSL
jgi:putative molybdenum carrier protein